MTPQVCEAVYFYLEHLNLNKIHWVARGMSLCSWHDFDDPNLPLLNPNSLYLTQEDLDGANGIYPDSEY